MMISILTTIIPSRQNSPVLHISLLIIGFIVLIIVLRYLLLFHKQAKQAEEAKSPRKIIDSALLKTTGTRLALKKDEIRFLDSQCKKNKIVELPLILSTEDCIEGPLKIIYMGICKNPHKLSKAELENTKLYLFMIIHKIENQKKNLSLLTNTVTFPENIPISYVNKNGIHYVSSILKNTTEGMFLAIAKNTEGKDVKPPPLSKVVLYLELKGDIAYQAESRVIRYQNFNDREEMLVSHTNNIEFFQRRKYHRIETSLRCMFKAVKIETDVHGKKIFLPQERAYKAIITDLSASGCRLKTNLPIRANQYLQIEVALSGNEEDGIVGRIVRSGKEHDQKWYIFNIQFVKMSKKTRNNIFSLVYDYHSEDIL